MSGTAPLLREACALRALAHPPRIMLKPISPVLAFLHGLRPMSLMCVCEKSSRPPETAMLNLRGRLPHTGLPRSPVSPLSEMRSERALQMPRVSTISLSSMPASGEPTRLRTLSSALWNDVWLRACRPSMMVGASSTETPRS